MTVDADVQQGLATARQEYDWLRDQACLAHAAGQPELAMRLFTAAAAFATHYHPGFFTDALAENTLLEIGRSITEAATGDDADRSALIPPAQATAPAHLLHVLSEISMVGGVWRTLIHWIRRDQDSRHTIVVLRQRDPQAVAWLQRELDGIDVPIVQFNADAGMFERARQLRALARQRYTACIQHVGQAETIPAVAFATPDCPPVLLVDHADHSFWLGLASCDLLVHQRPIGHELCRLRRGARACVVLPIPLAPRAGGPVDRASAGAGTPDTQHDTGHDAQGHSRRDVRQATQNAIRPDARDVSGRDAQALSRQDEQRAAPQDAQDGLPENVHQAERQRQRQAARQRLGMDAGQCVALSIGRSDKYRPMGDANFIREASRFADAHPCLALHIVGLSRQQAVQWHTDGALNERLVFHGEVPVADDLFLAADLYLESYPFGSQTAFLEAAQAGLAGVRAPVDTALLATSDAAIDSFLPPAKDEAHFWQQAARWLDETQQRQTLAEAMRSRVDALHTAEGWDEQLLALHQRIRTITHQAPELTVGKAGDTDHHDLALHRWHRWRGAQWTDDRQLRLLSKALLNEVLLQQRRRGDTALLPALALRALRAGRADRSILTMGLQTAMHSLTPDVLRSRPGRARPEASPNE